MALEARSNFAAPMFKLEDYQKQKYILTTCDIVGTFQGPHSDSAPGELCSFTSAHYTPGWSHAANADPCPSPASYDVKSLSAVNKTLLTSIKYWGPHTKGPFVAMDQRR